MSPVQLEQRCTAIADRAVPAYRGGKHYYSCTGYIARQWQAAWDGACIALGGNPDDYRGDPFSRTAPAIIEPAREALHKIADLGSCANSKRRVGALFQEAINIAVGAL